MTLRIIAEWDRKFAIWAYTVSHSRLLLRSVMLRDFDTRIDIHFDNTDFISMPRSFDTLRITELSPAESLEHTGKEASGATKAFLLNDEGAYVLATHCNWHEDNKDNRAPSHFRRFPPVP
ncbi:hypothetical protein [Streptomyces sp. AA1529]|uniref:hypothetical protein n=1 Tax=Streptomyces sp. AA1529 TaxID=1203257 RepID=UPI001319D1EC|nr:hypothetical protein [Streptomyces sp. AA1529]